MLTKKLTKKKTHLYFRWALPGNEMPALYTFDRIFRIERQKYLQQLRHQNYWTRFKNKYLAVSKFRFARTVVYSSGWCCTEVNYNNRVDWPLARILDIFPGRDNIARVALIKVNKGELIRSLERLIALELSTDNIINLY